jgi:hypothetical protein
VKIDWEIYRPLALSKSYGFMGKKAGAPKIQRQVFYFSHGQGYYLFIFQNWGQ